MNICLKGLQRRGLTFRSSFAYGFYHNKEFEIKQLKDEPCSIQIINRRSLLRRIWVQSPAEMLLLAKKYQRGFIFAKNDFTTFQKLSRIFNRERGEHFNKKNKPRLGTAQRDEQIRKINLLIALFIMFLLWNSFHSPQEKIKTLRQQLDENAIDLKELDVKEVSRIVINKRRYWYRRSIYELTISYDDGRPDRQCLFDGNINYILQHLENQHADKNNKPEVILHFWKPYEIYDAFYDAMAICGCFIGVLFVIYMFRMQNPDSLLEGILTKRDFKMSKSKAMSVRFKDVAGMEQSKKEITQFVDFLKKGAKFQEMGAKIPKGALLTGPPGTGKTMLAKACAGEAGVAFFYISGSEFVEMFVGLGASKVRKLFEEARASAPAIIFIDEIDAIGKKRETSHNEQKDSTLNQLLVEMDGFSTTQTIIVMAATNMVEALDSALTRPGRFDRIVQIMLPEFEARVEIFLIHLRPIRINSKHELKDVAKRLAELTPGFSGADIANLCNEAAIIATRRKQDYVELKDFEDASERIMAGYEKKNLVNAKTRRRIAYHEAGHAVCGWFLRGGDPLVKLTIIPRSKGALGYAQYLPKFTYLKTMEQIIDRISIMLGGLTSEQINFGDTSSGAADDLQKVYKLARTMVAEYGMGTKTYNVTLDEQAYVKKQSQFLSNKVDEQMRLIIQEAGRRARQILTEKEHIVKALAEELLKKETINGQQILEIMGERPVFDEKLP